VNDCGWNGRHAQLRTWSQWRNICRMGLGVVQTSLQMTTWGYTSGCRFSGPPNLTTPEKEELCSRSEPLRRFLTFLWPDKEAFSQVVNLDWETNLQDRHRFQWHQCTRRNTASLTSPRSDSICVSNSGNARGSDHASPYPSPTVLGNRHLLMAFRSHLTCPDWLTYTGHDSNLISRNSDSASYPEIPQQRWHCLIWAFRFRLLSQNALLIGRCVLSDRERLLETFGVGNLDPMPLSGLCWAGH